MYFFRVECSNSIIDGETSRGLSLLSYQIEYHITPAVVGSFNRAN